MRIARSIVVVALTSMLFACQGEPKGEEPSPEPAAEEPAAEQVPEEAKAPKPLAPMPESTHVRLAPGTDAGGWVVADASALSAADAARLGKAKDAAKELKKRISTRLETTLEQGPYADAFDLCKCATRPMCEGLGMDLGLKIGRTSFRLRNHGNTPPVWAAGVVDAVTEESHTFTAPDGKLGYVEAIFLEDGCVGCHGAPAELDPKVVERLAETFPDDEALGFEAGGLRGYVWVEVPTEATPTP